MPFELKKMTAFEKLKISIIKFIYSIINREKDFNFQNFTNWASRLGINLPLAFQARSARIEVVNAKQMIKNDEERIKKIESKKNKYKIDRNYKPFMVNTDDFKYHIVALKAKYTHLYIKYTVGKKETSGDNFNQEDFTLHFGGISKGSDGYFVTANAGDFKKLDNNGILSDSNPKNDTSFKDKNDELKNDQYKEFDECKMSGLIHFLETSGKNLGVSNWITDYLVPRKEKHFYIKMGCGKKDDGHTSTPNPAVVPVKSGSCDIKYLTSPIFTTQTNLTSSSFRTQPGEEYYDAGTGCCPQ